MLLKQIVEVEQQRVLNHFYCNHRRGLVSPCLQKENQQTKELLVKLSKTVLVLLDAQVHFAL